jgi:hypothetical protein
MLRLHGSNRKDRLSPNSWYQITESIKKSHKILFTHFTTIVRKILKQSDPISWNFQNTMPNTTQPTKAQYIKKHCIVIFIHPLFLCVHYLHATYIQGVNKTAETLINWGTEFACIGYIERTSAANTVNALVIVLRDSPCGGIRKWETCPILKADRQIIAAPLAGASMTKTAEY